MFALRQAQGDSLVDFCIDGINSMLHYNPPILAIPVPLVSRCFLLIYDS